MKKEYIVNSDGSGLVRIFKSNYSKSLEQITKFAKEAKKDFPFLKDEDIKVVVLTGSQNDRMTGIQFEVQDESKIPESYFKWSRQDDLGFCSSYN